MSPDDFSDTSPGNLHPTSFRERYSDGTYRDVEGLGFVPDVLPPEFDLGLLLIEQHQRVIEAERALSHLDGIAGRVENPVLLMRPLQYREAKLSSAIENTFASAKQMALFDVDPTTVGDKQKRDEVLEVNNYVRALHTGFVAQEPICLRLVKQLHAVLLDGVERAAGRVGDFRDSQNAIGRAGASFETARYVPPPHTELDRLLVNWERFLHESSSRIPRLIRFAIAHYQFEAIHPFDDGNGRMGRLLISLQLCEQAQLSKPLVYVSGYFEKNRSLYYDLLYEVSARGNWQRWIGFFLEAIREQASDAVMRFDHLTKLRETYQSAVREKRASALLPGIVDRLFGSPALSISDIQKSSGVSAQAAGALIKKLEDKNILIEVTGRAYHRVWLAHEIVDVIES